MSEFALPGSTHRNPTSSSRFRIGRANVRQAYDLAVTGGLGALFGLYLYVELVHAESVYVRDGLAGLLIGGSLGVFLNAYSPVRDGAWLQLARALAWGVPAAALGGAIGLMAGEVVIGLFRGGLLGRALSWSVLGLGIGLGQGLADRSRERMVYGLIGGGLGGFIGGFLFEWLRVALGDRYDAEPGDGDHDPGCWAGHVPGPGRTGAPPGLGSSPQRPPGGAHLSSIPPDAAAWVSTNEPRSASSVTPRSRAGTPRSRRLREVTSCTAWRRKVPPVSTDQSSPIFIPCKMEIGSSSGIRSWCFISAEADRFRMMLAPQIQSPPENSCSGP